jgi:hypothetical protein
MSLSSGDEVPHIFTRKSRLRPGEFLITSAKRVLQQYLPQPDSCSAAKCSLLDHLVSEHEHCQWASEQGLVTLEPDRLMARLRCQVDSRNGRPGAIP